MAFYLKQIHPAVVGRSWGLRPRRVGIPHEDSRSFGVLEEGDILMDGGGRPLARNFPLS